MQFDWVNLIVGVVLGMGVVAATVLLGTGRPGDAPEANPAAEAMVDEPALGETVYRASAAGHVIDSAARKGTTKAARPERV